MVIIHQSPLLNFFRLIINIPLHSLLEHYKNKRVNECQIKTKCASRDKQRTAEYENELIIRYEVRNKL